MLFRRARTATGALFVFATVHCSSPSSQDAEPSLEPLSALVEDVGVSESASSILGNPGLYCGSRWQACCVKKVDYGIPGHHRVTEKYCHDPSSLQCVNDACIACGGLGEPCCEETSCRDGGRCLGTCVACGGDGQLACTTGKPCRNETEQVGAICTACGGAGERLCHERSWCNPGLEPDSKLETCVPPWGREGQPCDPHGSCFNMASPTGWGLGCYAGTCESPCGHLGEECCRASIFDGYCRNAGLSCTLDVFRSPQKKCEACGGKDQPCCARSGCHGGLQCTLTGLGVNTCQPPPKATPGGGNGTDPLPGCGARGEPCCTHQAIAGFYCESGAYCGGTTCLPCGRKGEACCPSTTTSSQGSCSDGSRCSASVCS